jgi:glycosyltransferase involved in cell wall biosynthesis
VNIALYYPWLYLKSGGERLILELIRGSRHRWTVFTNRFDKDATYPRVGQLNVIELKRVPVKRSFGRVGQAAWRIVSQKLPLDDQDALLVVCEGLGDLVTFRNHEVPVFCICLTPLRAAFDPYYQAEYLIRRRKRYLPLALRAAAAGFRAIDRRAWKHYRHIFAISGEIRNRIVRGNLCPAEKVSVVRPGIDWSRLTPSGVYEKTFLVPGRIMWTKNIELGIEAFLTFCARRPDLSEFNLIIAGFVDEKSRPYIAKLRERAKACPKVRFIEDPSDDELFDLYRRAYAIVSPAFNEDLGLVQLEAMAMEKPVIAVDRGGPRETIVHGEMGFLLEPRPEVFASAMEALADDPGLVRRMGAAGRARAREFDWQTFCSAIDENLEQRLAREPVEQAVGQAQRSSELLAGSTRSEEAR